MTLWIQDISELHGIREVFVQADYAVLRSCERRAEIPMLVGELHEDMMGCSLDVFAGLFPGHRVEIEALPNGEHTFRAWLKQNRNRPKK